MRRGSSTVVSLVGRPHPGVLEALSRCLNVAAVAVEDGGLDAAIDSLRKAEGISAPYVVTTGDPLSEVATEWSAMWDPSAESHDFEERAGVALMAWRAKRFELPDYYVAVAARAPEPAKPHHEDFHLGVLRSERSARVAAIVSADEAREEVARVLTVLSHLRQGPWWPPLDQVIDTARRFFPGSLEQAASS